VEQDPYAELMQRVWKDKCLRRRIVPPSAEYTKKGDKMECNNY
jgi:hypothetical protein